jgi:uncharacterized protein (TIGR03083 family)
MPLPVTDTRHLFRPLCADIVSLLRSLPPEDWNRPTVAGTWRVRDVVAHMLDTALRRLSFHRDGLTVAPRTFEGERDLVAFINELNASWVSVAAERLSPRVLTDLYAAVSPQLADFMESLPLDAPARIPVSWAGEQASVNWLDIGREFTEIWHHGAQVRRAVGAAPFRDPAWLHAVLEIAMHALPHAYRDVPGDSSTSLAIVVTGDAGGAWTVRRTGNRWDVTAGREATTRATATMTDDIAWRLFFNALSPADAATSVRFEGDADLGRALLRTRSVVV